MLLSLLGLAFATHVSTFDVNARWTKAPFSGFESLAVNPAVLLAELRPLPEPLLAGVEAVANLAPDGERAIAFTNPIASRAEVALNGAFLGIVGPYATLRLEGVDYGAYTLSLRSPNGYVRTFAVRVAPPPDHPR